MSLFRSILLIDDDEIANHLHVQLINKHNISREVFIQANGKEAFDFIRKRYYNGKSLPSLIILDIDMPVQDGFGFLEQLLHSDLLAVKKIPVAILTNSARHEDMNRVKELGNFV
ncbi:MAG TPA: response regulator, partial [Cytophagaceae bacterium]|nr:response regulator [Cytophagaceae bacterium]